MLGQSPDRTLVLRSGDRFFVAPESVLALAFGQGMLETPEPVSIVRRINTTIRVSVQDGPELWSDHALRP